MSTDTDSARPADPGLQALVMLLRFQGVAADPGQIRYRLGIASIGVPEMLRCAKDLGLKARAHRTDWSRLANTPLPAIAALRDGGFLVVAKAAEDNVLVQSPLEPRPALMTRAELLAVWDGRLILMTRRAGLSDITRRFDITWFLGAIHKYRHLLSEVLVASFFLQLFALVSPLFFQVVIDGSGANSQHEQTILASLRGVQAQSTAFHTAGAARPWTRRDVAVQTVPSGCDASARSRRS